MSRAWSLSCFSCPATRSPRFAKITRFEHLLSICWFEFVLRLVHGQRGVGDDHNHRRLFEGHVRHVRQHVARWRLRHLVDYARHYLAPNMYWSQLCLLNVRLWLGVRLSNRYEYFSYKHFLFLVQTHFNANVTAANYCLINHGQQGIDLAEGDSVLLVRQLCVPRAVYDDPHATTWT